MTVGRIFLLLASLWLIPGVLTDLVISFFIVRQLLRDRRSSDLEADFKLLLAGLVLGFILLPLLIAAPLSGYLVNRRQR
ncbi:MAG: hypothetical protein ACUVRH_05795 [Candidatus Bipolaricaulia bacterium]